MELYEIVNKIDRLRTERGWTTYRLAEESGITQSTIFNMHSRGTLPSITTLSSVCNAFGISLSEFFAEDDKYDLDERERELIRYYRKMSCRDKKAVLELSRTLADK